MPNKGPFNMYPGENSKPSKFENVNFRDSDLKKAEGFPNMYPQNFNAARVAAVKAGKDSFNVGGKEFKVTSKVGAEMHHPGLYNAQFHPGNGKEGLAEGVKEEVVKDKKTPSKPVRIMQNRRETASWLNSPNPPKPKQPKKPNKYYK